MHLLFCSPYLRLDHFDGLIPFDFKTEPTDSNSKYLGESSAMLPLFVMCTDPPTHTHFLYLLCPAMLALPSKPPVLGAHLFLQRPFVRRGGPAAGVGLRPHSHTRARSNHQPR